MSDGCIDPQSSFGVADRILRAGDSLKRTVGAGVGGEEAARILGLARRAALQDRLATGGLMAVRERPWERSLAQLASGYARALRQADAPHEVARAA